jgi:cobalt-zinc-cadmium efflux system membrane fusion protein
MHDITEASSAAAKRVTGWSRSRQLAVLGIITAGVVAILGLIWLAELSFGRKEAAAEPPPPAGTFIPTAQQLKTLTVEAVTVRSFSSEERTEGKIAVNGDRSTPVFSPYSGRVERVIAGLGDSVAQGQPLATIQASELAQAQNDLRTAMAQVTLTRNTEARKHALYDIKGGSLADWQQAQADLATAEAALVAVRNRLRILGYTDQAIDGLAHADHLDATTNIVSPIAGVVVDREVGPGQYAQSGASTPVYTIADLSTVWLVANVREADSGHVQRGQSVEVHVLAYPDRTFKAHRLMVRAVIENGDRALKPEMFANFRILTSDAGNSPAVPEGAVVYEGETAHVWVLGSDRSLVIRPIRVGRVSDGFVEVLDGLKPGERVVTKGSLFIDRAAAG